MAMIQMLGIHSEHKRATYIILDGKAITFALAIRREVNNAIDRWAFYIGINQEEYNFLAEHGHECPDISFLGAPSFAISVSKIHAETFMQEPPAFFVGTHKDHDSLGDNWSSTSIIAHIEFFHEMIQKVLQK